MGAYYPDSTVLACQRQFHTLPPFVIVIQQTPEICRCHNEVTRIFESAKEMNTYNFSYSLGMGLMAFKIQSTHQQL